MGIAVTRQSVWAMSFALAAALLLSARARADRQSFPAPPLVAPRDFSPPRHSPWSDPSPELIEAMQAARKGGELVKVGRTEVAIEAFRQSALRSPRMSNPYVALVRAIHARMLAQALIWQRRNEGARDLLDGFARTIPLGDRRFADAIVQIIDVRLYLAAEDHDVKTALRLLNERRLTRRNAGCPSGPYFPEVLAPLHHDRRVATILRRMGCSPVVLDQLDELAARPMGTSLVDKGLPARPRQ